MKRTVAILILVLLLGLAFLLHRSPRAEAPRRSPGSEPVVEPLPPEPRPPAVAPAAPEPAPTPRTARVAPQARPPEPPPPVDLPGTAIVRGRVTVLGPPPPRKRINVSSDPQCVALHAGSVLSDTLVVGQDGGLRWAFVYVAQGINNQPPRTLRPPVLLDQVGCVYEPHVLGVQVGQPLNIYNNDPLLHNVHALPFDNLAFNFGLPTRGLFKTVSFDTPEVMIRIGCDVHPWMRAWVGVLDHPYFAVTNDTGSYGIPALPPGRYTIKVWHEAYATVIREVDVPPGGDIVLDFLLDARKQ